MADDLKNIFKKYASENLWGDKDSVSGPGSNLIQTEVIRTQIPIILRELNIKSFIDAPCGDFFWMQEIKPQVSLILEKYIGIDIVNDLIANNSRIYGDRIFDFQNIDIVSQKLPKVDMIFCRDCLVHLSFVNIGKVLRNFKKSGSKYLMTTTFTNRDKNTDIKNGDWRTLNLQVYPFNLPEPILLINENCTEENGIYSDKCLAIWEIQKIKINFFLLERNLALTKVHNIFLKILREIKRTMRNGI